MNPLHGSSYYFWSGIGNDLPVYLFGVLPLWIAWYKKNKCHVTHCHRLGHHQIGRFHVCKRHHPDHPGKVRLEHIMLEHKKNGIIK